jgi:hypothetical protein
MINAYGDQEEVIVINHAPAIGIVMASSHYEVTTLVYLYNLIQDDLGRWVYEFSLDFDED